MNRPARDRAIPRWPAGWWHSGTLSRASARAVSALVMVRRGYRRAAGHVTVECRLERRAWCAGSLGLDANDSVRTRSWHAGVDEPARPETFPLVRVRDSGREFMCGVTRRSWPVQRGWLAWPPAAVLEAGSGPPSSGPARPATTAVPAPHRGRHHHKVASHLPRRHRGTAGNGLLAVHDPGTVTGTLTGACRTRDQGLLPDRSCTPGAIDPAVTQANIGSTICRAGYTDSVRPPESQTEAFKWGVAEPAYGQHDVSGELDHLVPL